MMNATGYDCSIHEPTIRIGWTVLIVLYILLAGFVCHVIYGHYKKNNNFNKTVNSKLVQVAALSGLLAVLKAFEGVIRVTTDGKIGSHWGVTIVSALGGMLFYSMCATRFLAQWTAMITASAKMDGNQGIKIRNQMIDLKPKVYAYRIGCIGTYLVTIATQFTPDPNVADKLIGVFYFCIFIFASFLVVGIALPVTRMFKDILAKANERKADEKIALLQKKNPILS